MGQRRTLPQLCKPHDFLSEVITKVGNRDAPELDHDQMEIDLGDKESWDDSALVKHWEDSFAEYKVC